MLSFALIVTIPQLLDRHICGKFNKIDKNSDGILDRSEWIKDGGKAEQFDMYALRCPVEYPLSTAQSGCDLMHGQLYVWTTMTHVE